VKLNVLTNQSGEILAAHYTVTTPLSLPSRPGGSSSTSRIEPSEGESLHEVELPAELQRHIFENTFATEMLKYRLERDGELMRLVKSRDGDGS
jgi:hypothetical protein